MTFEDAKFLLALNNLSIIDLWHSGKVKFRCEAGHVIRCSLTLLQKEDYTCPKCLEEQRVIDKKKLANKLRTRSYLRSLRKKYFFNFKGTDKHGIYCIINNTLKIVYIGETMKSFKERWLGHLNKSIKGNFISKSPDKYKELIFHKDTKFVILYKGTTSVEENLEKEKFFISLYKRYTDYTVLGGARKDYTFKGDR